jgi:hypothetical protein
VTGRARLAVILVAAVSLPDALAAQTCSAPIPAGSCTTNTSTTLTIGTVLQLGISAASTTLTPPSTADYDAGFVANTGPTATVKSNRGWTLHISAAAGTWTATSTQPGVTARANKPAGDLQWSEASGGPFAGLTVSGAAAASGSASGPRSTTFYYHSLYGWALDTPGSYSLTVTFTLTTP